MSEGTFPPFTDPFGIDDIDCVELEVQIVMGEIEAGFARKAVDDESKRLIRGLTKEREDWRMWRQSGSKNKSLINGVRR